MEIIMKIYNSLQLDDSLAFRRIFSLIFTCTLVNNLHACLLI